MHFNDDCLALVLLACCGCNCHELWHCWNQWCSCHRGCTHGWKDFCYDYCCRHIPGFPGGPGFGPGFGKGFPGGPGCEPGFGKGFPGGPGFGAGFGKGFPDGPGCGPHDKGFPGGGFKGGYGAYGPPGGGFGDCHADPVPKGGFCCKDCGCNIPGGSGFKGFGKFFC